MRRIEAITGAAAEELMYTKEDLINGIRTFFNNSKDLMSAVRKTFEENADMHKQLENYMKEKENQIKEKLINSAQTVKGITLIRQILPLPPEVVKDIAFHISAEKPHGLFCVLGSIHQDKPLITLMISKDLISENGLHAGNIVREAAKLIQGGGGGAPHFATAGGKNPDGINAALDRAIELAKLS